jgi:uracil-DNA glycosylase
MQGVFIAKSASLVHHCGKHSLFVGWVVVGPNVEVVICMGEFAVQSVAQRAVASPELSTSHKGRWSSLSASMVN